MRPRTQSAAARIAIPRATDHGPAAARRRSAIRSAATPAAATPVP